MKILAFIALVICAPAFAANCNDSGNQSGMFPLGDAAKLASTITSLQKAVSANDRNAVADRVEFPLVANTAGQQRKLDRTQFLSRYEEVVTANVRNAIADARFRSTSDHDCVFWNSHGVMLGDGAVWINDDAQGEPKIFAINSTP